MDKQRVEQALKEILETKGQEIVQNHGAFKAAVFDLLDDIHFAEERLVLKHAMDANAFWTLLGSGSPTADSAKRAAEQLVKEHMKEEDAEFVVRCVAAVRGVNLDDIDFGGVPEEGEEHSDEEQNQMNGAGNGSFGGENGGGKAEPPQKKKFGKKITGVAAAVVIFLLAAVGVNSATDFDAEMIMEKQMISENAEGDKTENDMAKILSEPEQKSLNMLMEDSTVEVTDDSIIHGTVLGSKISRDSIAAVTFLDELNAMPETAWDVSAEQDGSVMAWVVPNADNQELYDLFIGAVGGVVGQNCQTLFAGYYNVVKIDFNNCFDTSRVTDMASMFYGCRSLVELDVSDFDTSRVTDMYAMFYRCENLTELDVSDFDTSRVMYMSYMFDRCESLTELDVSGFNTSQVTNMAGMFDRCGNLTELDVSGFNTSQVTDMAQMFDRCENLTKLDISGFNTNKVTSMFIMFQRCENLTELDVSGFNTSQVTDMTGMFEDCKNLTKLDVSGFNTSQVTNMTNMFYGCGNLTELDVSGFNISQGTDTSGMFIGCGITAEEAGLKK